MHLSFARVTPLSLIPIGAWAAPPTPGAGRQLCKHVRVTWTGVSYCCTITTLATSTAAPSTGRVAWWAWGYWPQYEKYVLTWWLSSSRSHGARCLCVCAQCLRPLAHQTVSLWSLRTCFDLHPDSELHTFEKIVQDVSTSSKNTKPVQKKKYAGYADMCVCRYVTTPK